MRRYDYMYLLTKDEYLRLKTQSNNTNGVGGGIGGDIQESQVNNIDASNGGSVTICDDVDRRRNSQNASSSPTSISPTKSTSKVEAARARKENNDGEGISASNKPRYRMSSSLSSTKKEKLAREKEVEEEDWSASRGNEGYDASVTQFGGEEEPMDVDYLEEGRGKYASQGYQRGRKRDQKRGVGRIKQPEFEAHSKKISSVNKRRNELVKHNDKVRLHALMKDRLNELQGKKSKGNKDRSDADRDKDRKIIHELRDVYKETLKENAGKKFLPTTTTKKRIRTDDDDDNVRVKRARLNTEREWYDHERTPAQKRSYDDDDEYYQNMSKRVKTRHKYQRIPAQKRLYDEIDQNASKRVKTRHKYQSFPAQKRLYDGNDQNASKRVKTRYERFPAKKRLYEERSSEEEDEFIPISKRARPADSAEIIERRPPSPPAHMKRTKRKYNDADDEDIILQKIMKYDYEYGL